MRPMSRWLYIISFLMIVLICTADGCSENPKATAQRETLLTSDLIDSIKKTFTPDTLSQAALNSYEISAIQRLRDLSDYLDTSSDTTLDLRVRNQAYEMIRDLFRPGEHYYRYLSSICPCQVNEQTDFLNPAISPGGLTCRLRPSHIMLSEKLQRVNNNIYVGELSFSQVITNSGREKSEADMVRTFTIEIFLIRNPKSFGSQVLNVWDIYLGVIGMHD